MMLAVGPGGQWRGDMHGRRAERMGEDVCPSFQVANAATKNKKERAVGPLILMASV
jgi:hypothetical protein